MNKIYVASSWRNPYQHDVVEALRFEGHIVYDFKNPCEGDKGFHWSEIDPNWKLWTPESYRKHLNHPIAERGYESDFNAMKWADTFVGVMPFGRSASFEMGWGCGNGKNTILLLSDGEPELMAKMFDFIAIDIKEVIEYINKGR